MKKVTFLLLGTLMIAGGLLISCQKKAPPSHPSKPAPHSPPDKPVPPSQPENPSGPCRKF